MLVVTAQRVLGADPTVIQVVPLTSTLRAFRSEVRIDPDPANGLDAPTAAQCQHVRAVSTVRVGEVRGNVGPQVLGEVQEVLALILDFPA